MTTPKKSTSKNVFKSAPKSQQTASLSVSDISRIIEMAWEDRTPFEAIETQFGLTEKETIRLMRREMKASSFRMWRKRVSGRVTKHVQRRGFKAGRFVCPTQRLR